MFLIEWKLGKKRKYNIIEAKGGRREGRGKGGGRKDREKGK